MNEKQLTIEELKTLMHDECEKQFTLIELRTLMHEWSNLTIETDTVSEFLDWLKTNNKGRK